MIFLDQRLPQRFWDKVQPTTDGCWIWIGGEGAGYGRFKVGGVYCGAHRVAFEAAKGPITMPCLDHLCRTPACVNPTHLEQVTYRENTMRGRSPIVELSRRTICSRGHPLSGENLYRWTDPRTGNVQRKCKTCNSAVSIRAQRIRRLRKRGVAA